MAIHPKVSATVVAGALTGLILSELSRRGVTIQADEAADITVLVSAVAAYWMPSGDGTGNGSPIPVPVPAPPPPSAPPAAPPQGPSA